MCYDFSHFSSCVQFVQHLIAELRKYGPYRLFATMRCEARNQGMKHLAMRSNWHNRPLTAAIGWCLMMVLHYRKGLNSALPVATVTSIARTSSFSNHVNIRIQSSLYATWQGVCRFEVFNRVFRLNDVVLVTEDNQPPVLGKIVASLEKNSEVICVLQLFQQQVLTFDQVYGLHFADTAALAQGPAESTPYIFEPVTHGTNLLHSIITEPSCKQPTKTNVILHV